MIQFCLSQWTFIDSNYVEACAESQGICFILAFYSQKSVRLYWTHSNMLIFDSWPGFYKKYAVLQGTPSQDREPLPKRMDLYCLNQRGRHEEEAFLSR